MPAGIFKVATFFVAFTLSPFLVGAERHVLWNRAGVRAENYVSQLEEIKPGDTVVFGDQEFKIEKILSWGRNLSRGSQDFIADIGGGRAIRFPLGTRKTSVSVQRFLEGYELLKDSTIPLVKVDVESSRPPQFAIMERLDVRFTLHELLAGQVKVSEETKAKLFKSLVQFATSTADFKSIGDFTFAQIVWVAGRGWVLIDFSGTKTERARPGETGHIFDKYDALYELPSKALPTLPIEVRKELGRALIRERKRRVKPCDQLKNLA